MKHPGELFPWGGRVASLPLRAFKNTFIKTAAAPENFGKLADSDFLAAPVEIAVKNLENRWKHGGH
jgi:hypothetical protein